MPANTSSLECGQPHGSKHVFSQVGSNITLNMKNFARSNQRSVKQSKESKKIITTNIGSPLEMLIVLPNQSIEQEGPEMMESCRKSESTAALRGDTKRRGFSNSRCSDVGLPRMLAHHSEIGVCAMSCHAERAESENSLSYSVSQCPSESNASLAASFLFESSNEMNSENNELTSASGPSLE